MTDLQLLSRIPFSNEFAGYIASFNDDERKIVRISKDVDSSLTTIALNTRDPMDVLQPLKDEWANLAIEVRRERRSIIMDETNRVIRSLVDLLSINKYSSQVVMGTAGIITAIGPQKEIEDRCQIMNKFLFLFSATSNVNNDDEAHIREVLMVNK